MNDIQSLLRHNLIGQICENFKFAEVGTLILYFAASPTRLAPARMWIDCAWRCRKGDRVLVGSFDPPESIMLIMRLLQGCCVTDVCVDIVSGDLRFNLDGFVVECFCYSITGEHWEFRGADGLRAGIGPNLESYQRMEAPDTAAE